MLSQVWAPHPLCLLKDQSRSEGTNGGGRAPERLEGDPGGPWVPVRSGEGGAGSYTHCTHPHPVSLGWTRGTGEQMGVLSRSSGHSGLSGPLFWGVEWAGRPLCLSSSWPSAPFAEPTSSLPRSPVHRGPVGPGPGTAPCSVCCRVTRTQCVPVSASGKAWKARTVHALCTARDPTSLSGGSLP